jgi:hypothetical protein
VPRTNTFLGECQNLRKFHRDLPCRSRPRLKIRLAPGGAEVPCRLRGSGREALPVQPKWPSRANTRIGRGHFCTIAVLRDIWLGSRAPGDRNNS